MEKDLDILAWKDKKHHMKIFKIVETNALQGRGWLKWSNCKVGRKMYDSISFNSTL